jgi:hypothetical protein
MVLGETVWGEMSAMTVGSFQVFTTTMILTGVLQVKVRVSPKI